MKHNVTVTVFSVLLDIYVHVQGAELPLLLSTTHSPVLSTTDPTKHAVQQLQSPVITNHSPIATST